MTKYNWTEQQEQLLITWAEKSSGYSWLHSKSMSYYRHKNLYISIPAAILSYVAGSASLIFSNETDNDSYDVSYNAESSSVNVQKNNNDKSNKYKYLCIGFAGIISGILSNFQEVFKYKELSEQHRISSLQHLTFFRDISTELSLHPKNRHDPMDYIKTKKVEYGKLLEQSPIIPQSIIKKFEKKFNKVKIHKPDVATNLQTIMAYSNHNSTPSDSDMEHISEWIKKRKVQKSSMIEIANSNSECESNSDMIEIANSENGSDEEVNIIINTSSEEMV
tara:strand:+ start:756 stop:1586 length:831 start_codon:yes stop_codon:yes gene_type:complete